MLDARPYWRHIGGLFGLSLLSSVFALLTPLPLKIAVDSVVGSHPLPRFLAVILPTGVGRSQGGVLLVAAGLLVLISVLRQLQQFANLLLTTYAGEKLLLQFRSRLFRHAERVSLAYHDSRGTADSTYRIQYDAVAIQSIAVGGLIPFFTAIVTVTGMIYVTARIDGRLALVSLAVVPILLFMMRVYRMRLRRQWHEAKRLESSALSVVQESLGALRVVKAFGREDHARDRFADGSAASVRAKVSVSFLEGRFGIVVGVTIGVGMGTILVLGTRRVIAGTMTLGELVLVMGYLQQLYDPLKTASKKLGSLQSSLASADRVYSLLDEASDFVDPPGACPLARAAGGVAFQNVSFGYEPGQPVLHDVSFEVPPGTRLGIVGTTGAGKTTLASLLTRFYDPSGGQILIDGVDLREYRLADLRNQFAIVLQEPVLFSTSIAENIAYARPGCRDADIVAAAKAASADEFIRALPDGYSTPVGERGVRLSGGERQRIALARAFLKDASILILDEPTSSVDTGTEGEILEAMERLMHGRTTFLIAHRSSTLAICDTRLELEHGRVIGVTPHNRGPQTPGDDERSNAQPEVREEVATPHPGDSRWALWYDDGTSFTTAFEQLARGVAKAEREQHRDVMVMRRDGRDDDWRPAEDSDDPALLLECVARRHFAPAGRTRAGAPARRRPKHVPVACHPLDHPVVKAWEELAPARARIDRVDRLRAKEKAEIYRLGLANGATSVIAKRAHREALLVERTIYESVLPRLPLPALRYFGFVVEQDGEFAWLFIEDAGDDPCSLAEHGPLAARWLGTLHGAAAELDPCSLSLPEGGPGGYLEHLRHARTAILDNFDNPALGVVDRSTLQAVISALDVIEPLWGGVEALCRDLPRTLVHGDLVDRNLRLRRDDAGPAFVAFDWECSGFGIPAADVYRFAVDATRYDLSCYRSTICEYTRGVKVEELRRLLLLGNGFLLLASADWATSYLRHPWVERPMATLRCYERPLREWGQRLAASAAWVER
jgi:ATP-binding cassette subfamily B protein